MSEKPEHGTEIIVNARPKKWNEATISYEQLVALAFPGVPANPNQRYAVTYRKGNQHGELVEGQSVPVQNGMIFDVTLTNKS